MAMEKAVSEARAEIVRYYEDRGYTHKHAETYVPHDPDQVMRICNIIQKETNPQVPNEQGEPVGFLMSRSKWNRADLDKVG